MSRSSLRDLMNRKPRDPHFYLVNAHGWVYCVDSRFYPPGLVGSDGGGIMPRTWRTPRGAEAFARKLPDPSGVTVKFSEYAP